MRPTTTWGNRYAVRGDREKALYHYRRALDIHPGNGLAHNNLGNLYLEGGNVKKAEHHYREALSSKSDVENALNNLGVIHYRRGDYTQAEDYYVQALALNPHAAQTLNNLALIRWDRGDVSGAIKKVRKSLTWKPVYPAAERNLARFLALSGDTEGARAVLAGLTGAPPPKCVRGGPSGGHLSGRREKRRALSYFSGKPGKRRKMTPYSSTGRDTACTGWGFPVTRKNCTTGPSCWILKTALQSSIWETCFLKPETPRRPLLFSKKNPPGFPGSPEIFHNLAVYREREGDLPKAMTCLERALSVQPDYPPSLDLLAKLGGGGVK